MSRCCVCGKQVEPNEVVAMVQRGRLLEDGEFSPKSTWGVAHFDPCFERAFDSPKMVLERVKKLAKSKPVAEAE